MIPSSFEKGIVGKPTLIQHFRKSLILSYKKFPHLRRAGKKQNPNSNLLSFPWNLGLALSHDAVGRGIWCF